MHNLDAIWMVAWQWVKEPPKTPFHLLYGTLNENLVVKSAVLFGRTQSNDRSPRVPIAQWLEHLTGFM